MTMANNNGIITTPSVSVAITGMIVVCGAAQLGLIGRYCTVSLVLRFIETNVPVA